MRCNEFKEKVADLFDKTIDKQTQAELDEHMKSCPECKAYYDELREAFDMLQPISIEKIKGEKEKKAVADSSSQNAGAGGSFSSTKSTIFILRSSFMKVAAIFIAAAFLCGLAYAAYHVIVPTKEEKVVDEYADKKMFVPFRMPKEASEWHKKRFGDGICVYWCKGTWVINGDDSFVEEHPFCAWGYTFFEKNTTIRLDGKVLDINNLPDLPASALKKMEIHYNEDGHGMVLLSTKPVQIPANVKGNINPELTILLTGTPPAGNPMKTSIYVKNGTDDSFDWKNHYQGTSWEWEKEDISSYLKEVSYRKDHHVRINVCKGTPQKHIDRIKSIMQECNVKNYELEKQK